MGWKEEINLVSKLFQFIIFMFFDVISELDVMDDVQYKIFLFLFMYFILYFSSS